MMFEDWYLLFIFVETGAVAIKSIVPVVFLEEKKKSKFYTSSYHCVD